MDLDFMLKHSYGVVRTTQLQACGLTAAQIRSAAAGGRLVALRRGWYASGQADPRAISAVRAGGVLTCVSALRLHGYWTPSTSTNHIRLTRHGRGVAARPAGSGVRQCSAPGDSRRPSGSVDGTLTALRHLPGCVTDDELIAVIDSMLHQRRVGMSEVQAAFADHPQRVRDLLLQCDRRAESGTESLARVRLRRLRLRVAPQVTIPGVGRVDLLIGDRLVIEVDSWEHHGGRDAYENDRYRDIRLNEKNYLVLRPTYHRVTDQWDSLERAVRAIVARRDHLWSRWKQHSSQVTGE